MSTIRWIPISDRKPPDDTIVYVTQQCWCGCGVRHIDLAHYDDERDRWTAANEKELQESDDGVPPWPIIAWAECPVRPYRGNV
jgi:hypothetical protein